MKFSLTRYKPCFVSIYCRNTFRNFDLVINIPEGTVRIDEVSAGYLMRRAAVDFGTSLLTNIKLDTILIEYSLFQPLIFIISTFFRCAALFCDASMPCIGINHCPVKA